PNISPRASPLQEALRSQRAPFRPESRRRSEDEHPVGVGRFQLPNALPPQYLVFRIRFAKDRLGFDTWSFPNRVVSTTHCFSMRMMSMRGYTGSVNST